MNPNNRNWCLEGEKEAKNERGKKDECWEKIVGKKWDFHEDEVDCCNRLCWVK